MPDFFLSGPITLANAGTALMWAGIFHLFIGNTIIGTLEGLLLAWFFKCSRWRSILVLVIANYVSAWVGFFFIGSFKVFFTTTITLENVLAWNFLFIVLAFLVTVLIEWPFFRFALGTRPRAFLQAAKATLLVHVISYTLLIMWYWQFSSTSMVTKMKIVQPSAIQLKEGYTLYYINSKGDQVEQMDLSDATKSKLAISTPALDDIDRLLLRSRDGMFLDLYAYSPYREESDKEILLREGIARHHLGEQVAVEVLADGMTSNPRPVRGTVPSLATSGTDWLFHTGFWSADGIVAENLTTKKKARYVIDTPFIGWDVSDAVQLEDGKVLLRLGVDQICLLDVAAKTISLIARGKAPLILKTINASDASTKVPESAIDSP